MRFEGGEKHIELKVDKTGVYLDGHPIKPCTGVDIKKIDPINSMEVVLHVCVDKADIQWSVTE